MKNLVFFTLFVFVTGFLPAIESKILTLNQPDKNRGIPVMKALSQRASADNFDDKMLNLQDLSDLLWAANGINRADSGKRTAPSAMNAQDVDIYLAMEDGIYLYDAKKHILKLMANGDYRKLAAGNQLNVAKAPVICLLVSDISRFPFGEESLKLNWAAIDVGIVSQNISIFCASIGLSTRPRASMNQEKLRSIMKLKKTEYLMLNHPVSYKN